MVAFVAKTGSGVQIRDAAGRLVDASPGYANLALGLPEISKDVIARGLRVG